jgi:hypothetical protein
MDALAKYKNTIKVGVTALMVSILPFPKNCQSKLAFRMIKQIYGIVKAVFYGSSRAQFYSPGCVVNKMLPKKRGKIHALNRCERIFI